MYLRAEFTSRKRIRVGTIQEWDKIWYLHNSRTCIAQQKQKNNSYNKGAALWYGNLKWAITGIIIWGIGGEGKLGLQK